MDVFEIRTVNLAFDYSTDSKLEVPILLQDANGPCPLIALVNTLIVKHELQSFSETEPDSTTRKKNAGVLELRNLLTTHASASSTIGLQPLLAQLGDLMLVFQKEHNEIDHLLESLPLLHTGLSVNPNLINGGFEENLIATQLFRHFDLPLRHGWCVNRIDNEDVEWNFSGGVVGGAAGSVTSSYSSEENTDNYLKLIELMTELQTFDRVQDYLLMNGSTTSVDQIELLKNQKLLNKWLKLNQTQLTAIGIKRTNLELHDEEFAVFFRNNHFNTLFKRSNLELYLLVTDAQVNNPTTNIVWQSLNSVSGKDDLFFTGDFLPVFDIDLHGEQDYLLSRQLQEEEDAKAAKALESRNRGNDNTLLTKGPVVRKESEGKKQSSAKKKEKKKKDCIIV